MLDTDKKGSRLYYTAIFLILIIAFFLRAYLLDLRPLHSDEGVNFMFMEGLIKEGRYRYDPENYHGPTLYYLTFLPLYYFGKDTSWLPDEVLPSQEYVYRICPMLLGFGVVLILILLRGWLKTPGLLTAMALAAISPTAVYYSRDNIHEMYLMFFTACTFVFGYLFYATSKDRYLYLCAASLALMFATKETTIITLGIWGLSAFGASLFSTKPLKDVGKKALDSIKKALRRIKKPSFLILIAITILTLCLMLFFQDYYKKYELKWYLALLTKGVSMMTIFLVFTLFFGRLRGKLSKLLIASALFFIILCLFFSSFFTHAEGVGKFFKAFELWTHQGTVGSKHTKPFPYYLELLSTFERPILILGLLGIIFSFWKRKPEEVFTSLYAVGTFLAFSLIPYKTPWCVQNMMLPLFILSGVFIKYVFEITPYKLLRLAYLPFILIILLYSLYQSADVNYINYDNDSYGIVYVQTNRSAKELVQRVDELSRVKYEGEDTKILIDAEGTLPLNWYFRNHKHFWLGAITQDIKNYPIIIANRNKESEIEKILKNDYRKEGYPFNPATGNFLALYYKDVDFKKEAPKKIILTEAIELGKKESKLKPGLAGTIFQNVYFRGRKLGKVVDRKIYFWYDTDKEKPFPAPFSIIWKGIIKIPESGEYLFSTISDDGSFLDIYNNT